MDLDREISGVHERYWDNERERCRGKTVVLVEGDDDRTVLESFFRARRTSWQFTVSVVAAGGRKQVQSRMSDRARFPLVYGVVDRDTWTDAEIAVETGTNRDLRVTGGWCIENVFLDPTWLRGFDAGIAARVGAHRDTWVRAGALWWTLQRSREAQQRGQEALGWSYGAPHEDLDLSSASTLADSLSRLIPEPVLTAARFDAPGVAERFEQRYRDVLDLPEEAQWRVGVHGKQAFARVLVPALNAARYQQSPTDWKRELAFELGRRLPAPFDDLVALLFP